MDGSGRLILPGRNSAARRQRLAARGQRPAARGQRLAARGRRLTARRQRLAARRQGLAARGQRLAARGQGLAARGQRLAARGQRLAARGQRLILGAEEGRSMGLSSSLAGYKLSGMRQLYYFGRVGKPNGEIMNPKRWGELAPFGDGLRPTDKVTPPAEATTPNCPWGKGKGG